MNSMSCRILIVANPASGRGRARAALWEITRGLARAGLSWEVVVSRSREDLRPACRSAGPGYNALVAVGGDGTVNEILQEARSDGLPLAIWPAGTANLVARELGFTRDADRLAAALARGDWAPMDLGECRWPRTDLPPRRFAACVGAGFDARVVRAVAGRRRGKIRWTAYLGPFLGEAWRSGGRLMARLDDGPEWEGSQVVVSNLVRYGGFFRIAPEARFDDGRLDLCLFEGDRPIDILRYAWGALRARHALWPDVRLAAGRRIALRTASGEIPVQLDGEPLGVLPVEIDVVPAAVRVVRGRTEFSRES